MEDDWGKALVARQKLKGKTGQMESTKTSWEEHVYKLAEHVKNDDDCRKRNEGGEELKVADICETGEGEVLQGENRSQVSCHSEGGRGQADTSQKTRGLNKSEKSIVPLSLLGRRRLRLRSIKVQNR